MFKRILMIGFLTIWGSICGSDALDVSMDAPMPVDLVARAATIEVGIQDGPAAAAVRAALAGGTATTVGIPDAMLAKFGFFQTAFADHERIFKADVCSFSATGEPLGIASVESGAMNPITLQNLFNLLQGKDSRAYSIEQLVDMIYLADYLMINDWHDLFNRINLDQLPSLAVNLSKMPAINVPLLISPYLINKALDGAVDVYWNERTDHFFVKRADQTGQLYDGLTGAAIGTQVANVDTVVWSPRGDRYAVKITYIDGEGNQVWELELHGLDGALIGTPLQDGNDIFVNWSLSGDYILGQFADAQRFCSLYDADLETPSDREFHGVEGLFWLAGDFYFIITDDGCGQLYDKFGNAVGPREERVHWARSYNNGKCYLIRYSNKTVQIYSAAGVRIGGLLLDVDSFFWLGEDRFLITSNGEGQLYDSGGSKVGAAVKNVEIALKIPHSDCYFMICTDRTGQLYDGAGVGIGSLLEDIDFVYVSDYSSNYFVKFNDGSGQIYNLSESVIGKDLDIEHVVWSPKGDCYFVIRGESAQMYNVSHIPIGLPIAAANEVCWARGGDFFTVFFADKQKVRFYKRFNMQGLPLHVQVLIKFLQDGFEIYKVPANFSSEILELLPLGLKIFLKNGGYLA